MFAYAAFHMIQFEVDTCRHFYRNWSKLQSSTRILWFSYWNFAKICGFSPHLVQCIHKNWKIYTSQNRISEFCLIRRIFAKMVSWILINFFTLTFQHSQLVINALPNLFFFFFFFFLIICLQWPDLFNRM